MGHAWVTMMNEVGTEWVMPGLLRMVCCERILLVKHHAPNDILSIRVVLLYTTRTLTLIICFEIPFKSKSGKSSIIYYKLLVYETDRETDRAPGHMERKLNFLKAFKKN